MTLSPDLDAAVRKADPDRWQAARFVADPARRGDLVALYAFNDELARVAEQVSTPMIGDIRLAWWREGAEAVVTGEPMRAHPVLQALVPAAGRLDLGLLEAMIQARAADLDPEPFADEAALVAYIDGTAGALMAAAARLLDPAAGAAQLTSAARAWGWAGLWRAGPALAARGRRWTPLNWGEANEAEIGAHVGHRVAEALKASRNELADLRVAAFPAVAYATLAGPYARGRQPSDLEKQFRLLAAVVKGRL
ncbi:MAG TPA: squalene/phytoene synthase family protein [Caulobacteraceae bacterium]|jgi:phytoene synthase|nr:squalene/phytoene synthase family protein [Caulobacteraceae bacterium]